MIINTLYSALGTIAQYLDSEDKAEIVSRTTSLRLHLLNFFLESVPSPPPFYDQCYPANP